MKYLNYIFSILLIFSLTVNECILYSQNNAKSYFQTAQVARIRRVADIKVYYFAKGRFLKNVFVLFKECFQTRLYHFKKQVRTILYTQKTVVLRLKDISSAYLFLNKSKIHSDIAYSSLYRVA
jgi:hypothetical protein